MNNQFCVIIKRWRNYVKMRVIMRTIIDGALTELKDVPDNVIAYQRELDGQIISVYVNLGAGTETVSYPNDSQTIVLQNRDDIVVDNGELKLPAYSAIVLAQ